MLCLFVLELDKDKLVVEFFLVIVYELGFDDWELLALDCQKQPLSGLFRSDLGCGIEESQVPNLFQEVTELLSVINLLQTDNASIIVPERPLEPAESLFPRDFWSFRAALQII